MAGRLPEPDINYGMKFFLFPGKPEFFIRERQDHVTYHTFPSTFQQQRAMPDNYFPLEVTTGDSFLKAWLNRNEG
jgi:hypothetical protein